MHNETKVNTKIGDVTSPGPKNPVPHSSYAEWIDMPCDFQQIRRLAGIADTIGAMLGTFAWLPPTGRDDALAVSASLADDLAQSLAALVEGAQ